MFIWNCRNEEEIFIEIKRNLLFRKDFDHTAIVCASCLLTRIKSNDGQLNDARRCAASFSSSLSWPLLQLWNVFNFSLGINCWKDEGTLFSWHELRDGCCIEIEMYLMTDVYDLPAYTGNKLEQTVTKDLRVPPRVIIPPCPSST